MRWRSVAQGRCSVVVVAMDEYNSDDSLEKFERRLSQTSDTAAVCIAYGPSWVKGRLRYNYLRVGIWIGASSSRGGCRWLLLFPDPMLRFLWFLLSRSRTLEEEERGAGCAPAGGTVTGRPSPYSRQKHWRHENAHLRYVRESVVVP